MRLSESQCKSLVYGVYSFRREGEYLAPCRFSAEQEESLRSDEFFYARTRFTAGVSLRLHTDAEELRFDYKRVAGTLKDSVDAYVNGRLLRSYLMEELEEEGTLAVALPAGEKLVLLYFPTDAEMRIKNLRIEGSWRPAEPAGDRVLWIGDSIAQGVGSFLGGQTFVNLVSRAFDYRSLNQGIGGYGYFDRAIKPLPDFPPDKIVVALGTNDSAEEGLRPRIEAFYRTLDGVFRGIPVLAVTPVWRGDDPVRARGLEEVRRTIKEVCAAYPNVKTVDGETLLPPQSDYFWDDLHPNARGMEQYADNLTAAIAALNF